MSSLDRLWKEWQHTLGVLGRFKDRPEDDPIRRKWAAIERVAREAFEDEQGRLLDPEARLHP